MIFLNLMVTDVPKSAQFYIDTLGMRVQFYVDTDLKDHTHPPGPDADLILASLQLEEAQLMLEKDSALANELPHFANQKPNLSGTIYFRNTSVDDTRAKLTKSQIVKEPFTQWYGMRELYFYDPDGYTICVGEMDGPPPN
ncbi:MAG: VOC family protein [Pseudomonadota bacterium]